MTEPHRRLLTLLAAVEEISADAASREGLASVQLLLENHALALGVATQGDEWLATALADDVTWTATGESYLAGTWTGRDDVMAMRETSNPDHASLQQPPHKTRVLDAMVSERHAVLLRAYASAVPGDDFASVNGLILEIREGRIVSVRRFDVDQKGFDAHVARWIDRPETERRQLVDGWLRELRQDSGSGSDGGGAFASDEVFGWSRIEIVPQNLRVKRQDTGMSRDNLATAANLSRARIDQLEAGTRPGVRAKTAVALARALNCATSDIAIEAARP